MYKINAILLSLIIYLLCTQNSIATVIYKWVDANGVTHYSQQVPKGVVSEKLYSEDFEQQKIGFTSPTVNQKPQQSQDEMQDITAQTIKKQDKKQAESICNSAKHSLNILLSHTLLRSVSEDGKTVTAMTEEDRQAQIKEQQKRVELFCDS